MEQALLQIAHFYKVPEVLLDQTWGLSLLLLLSTEKYINVKPTHEIEHTDWNEAWPTVGKGEISQLPN